MQTNPDERLAIESGEEPNKVVKKAPREKKRKKAKEKGRLTVGRVLASIAIIIVGVFLLLFVVSKAAHYDSIASMLNHMYGEAMYMWENRG